MQNLHSLQGIKKNKRIFLKKNMKEGLLLCLNSIPTAHSYGVCITELKALL